ncbi:hypothetical protein VULLAG_LOCUS13905 [Vulpes lagopus]
MNITLGLYLTLQDHHSVVKMVMLQGSRSSVELGQSRAAPERGQKDSLSYFCLLRAMVIMTFPKWQPTAPKSLWICSLDLNS